ncbi:MAG TPA: DJ-1/PfpI family protein [Dissulfurispiraceae bacterium]|nr:DJ-1/PfpI family protein [Dissulfurispiraceae bacterium]
MKALIVIADKFEDSQLLVPLYWLQEEGVKVDIASNDKGLIIGARGHEIEVSKSIYDVRPDDYSALVLPGSRQQKAVPNRLLDMLHYFVKKDKIIAAMCEGLQILISAGILKGRRAVWHESVLITELMHAGLLYEFRDIVVDGKIVTCRRSAGLPAFAKALIGLIENEKWYYTMEDVLAPCMN